MGEVEHLRARLSDAEIQLDRARSDEDRAHGAADQANGQAVNFREDVSFLTKEQQRLNEELRIAQASKTDVEDQLRRVQVEF
jgi:chromosome segregation ATPase